MTGFPDTVYGNFTTQTRLQSETADNLLWARYATPSPDNPLPSTVNSALTRITFREHSSPSPLHYVLDEVRTLQSSCSRAGGRGKRLVTLVGRSRRLAVEDHTLELRKLAEERVASGEGWRVGGEVRKTVGDVATAMVGAGLDVGIVVMQACRKVDYA